MIGQEVARRQFRTALDRQPPGVVDQGVKFFAGKKDVLTGLRNCDQPVIPKKTHI